MTIPTPLPDRFWALVDKQSEDDCWPWMGFIYAEGYGGFWVSTSPPRRKTVAHRVSWELHNGPIPNGLFVLHRCDVRPCVNPNHLFLGTRRDNTQDMIAKRRGLVGSLNGHAKLTEADVEHILTSPCSVKELLGIYPVSPARLYDIRRGTAWRHVYDRLLREQGI